MGIAAMTNVTVTSKRVLPFFGGTGSVLNVMARTSAALAGAGFAAVVFPGIGMGIACVAAYPEATDQTERTNTAARAGLRMCILL